MAQVKCKISTVKSKTPKQKKLMYEFDYFRIWYQMCLKINVILIVLIFYSPDLRPIENLWDSMDENVITNNISPSGSFWAFGQKMVAHDIQPYP